jgi:hypothetical protein
MDSAVCLRDSNMSSIAKSALIAAAVFASAAAQTPGIRPVPDSRKDRALTANAAYGQTYLAARDLQVDLAFPGGGAGKGRGTIVFEPSTGFFFHRIEWARTLTRNLAPGSIR